MRKSLENEVDRRYLDESADFGANRPLQDDVGAGNTGRGEHGEEFPLLSLKNMPNISLVQTK
jgi:hypothetical protein